MGMILVNHPGRSDTLYGPLKHAEWFGWTAADLIFPFFLFIVGITTDLSLTSRREQGHKTNALVGSILRRGVLITSVGLLLTGFPYHEFYITLPGGIVFDSRTAHLDLAHWRFTGVLQRIGLCYTFGALLTLRTTIKQQVAIVAALLLGYWFAMTLVPVPGLDVPNLAIPEASLAAWLDRGIFGNQHLWKGSQTWDPEGLLSTIPAIGTTILGVLAGSWLRSARALGERIRGLAGAGVLLVIAGLIWNEVFPISKNIWTSSYVLFTGGGAALTLAACLWIIDVRGIKKWAGPFVIYGVNPLFAYVVSSFFARLIYTLFKVPTSSELVSVQSFVFNSLYAPWLPSQDASLLYSITTVAGLQVLLSVLHRRGIVIKL